MSQDNEEKDWSGYLIKAPHDVGIEDGHAYFITSRWKPETHKNLWWWRCADCYESAGVISSEQLEKFNQMGLAQPPDDDDYVKILEDTKHPKDDEDRHLDYYRMYNWD